MKVCEVCGSPGSLLMKEGTWSIRFRLHRSIVDFGVDSATVQFLGPHANVAIKIRADVKRRMFIWFPYLCISSTAALFFLLLNVCSMDPGRSL